MNDYSSKKFECDCHHPDHILTVSYESDVDSVYLDIGIRHSYSLLSRLYYALKVAINPSKYTYASIILNGKAYKDVIKYLDEISKDKNANREIRK